MTAELRLPRMLGEAAGTDLVRPVEGRTVTEVLSGLFDVEPGLRNHLVDETGEIRPHVLVFVDGRQADLTTSVTPDSKIRVLHAVSGG